VGAVAVEKEGDVEVVGIDPDAPVVVSVRADGVENRRGCVGQVTEAPCSFCVRIGGQRCQIVRDEQVQRVWPLPVVQFI
jgi:hypothetical protein